MLQSRHHPFSRKGRPTPTITDFRFELAVHLALSVRPDFDKGRRAADEREELNEEEARVLDLLERGLSHEFPNPQRVGVLPLRSSKASLIGSYDWLRSTSG